MQQARNPGEALQLHSRARSTWSNVSIFQNALDDLVEEFAQLKDQG